MTRQPPLLNVTDFSRYGNEAALVMTNELNSLLQECLQDPEQKLDNPETLSVLKEDMINAPDLYLETSTLTRLQLLNFTNSPPP